MDSHFHGSSDPGANCVAAWSNLEALEKPDAFLRKLHVLLDEVVLDATDLRSRKRLHPVDAALSESHRPAARTPSAGCRGCLEIHVLQMHRDEAAGVSREVVSGDEAAADRGHLELELDQLRIEQLHQDVVGPLAVDH